MLQAFEEQNLWVEYREGFCIHGLYHPGFKFGVGIRYDPYCMARRSPIGGLLLVAEEKIVPEHTTFSNGCLGSHNDEERSEMRYVT